MTNNEALNWALDNGIIDINTIQLKCKEMKDKQILDNHPYSIWCGADGYWRTKLLVNGKKKIVKKKCKDALIQAIIEHYSNNDETTFKGYFDKWVERKSILGRCDSTVYRYETDYARFIKGTAFEKLQLADITEADVATLVKQCAEKAQYKALITIFGYVRDVFEIAKRKKIIEDNPCDYIELCYFKKYCVPPKKKTAKERTLSNDERKLLLDKMDQKHSSKPNYIPAYAVHLSIYTGLRVGELAGLKWEDVDYKNKVLTICRSEKYNRKTKEYYISDTKNDKVRQFPITDEIEKLLKQIWKVESEYEYLCEYVFANENGKLHTNIISDCARNSTLYDDRFSCVKSIHANRRTLNSNLRCNGVSVTVASALLGHTEKVNENNYTYDVMDNQYKLDVVAQANLI